MTTEKQKLANQKNALLSTGAKTPEGKAVVSKNAVKYGIFAKINSPANLTSEEKEQYPHILQNMIESLQPTDQLQNLLVEKITIDFIRLQRVLNFEAGSIMQFSEELNKETFNYSRKDNSEIHEQISRKEEHIDWINKYLVHLENKEVNFDQEIWEEQKINSRIIDDFYLIADSIAKLEHSEREKMRYGEYDLKEIKDLIYKYGYASSEKISEKLYELYIKEIEQTKKEINELENAVKENNHLLKKNQMLGSLPTTENTNKVLKYEQSLQKSINHNITMLKNLQNH